MSESFKRYAIFWLPPAESAPAQFGRDWFGVCPERGELGEPSSFGLPAALAAEAIARPRRYTLHGTIMAPFRPADGVTAAMIADELHTFCARRATRRTSPLRLARLTRHLALIPEGGTAGLDWLAADCVTHFNRFRASTTEDELERFPPDQHPPRQRQQVREFGYPYVLSDFLFHITLAGPLERAQLDQVEAALAPQVAPMTAELFEFGSLCLLGETDQATPFRLIARCALLA